MNFARLTVQKNVFAQGRFSHTRKVPETAIVVLESRGLNSVKMNYYAIKKNNCG